MSISEPVSRDRSQSRVAAPQRRRGMHTITATIRKVTGRRTTADPVVLRAIFAKRPERFTGLVFLDHRQVLGPISAVGRRRATLVLRGLRHRLPIPRWPLDAPRTRPP